MSDHEAALRRAGIVLPVQLQPGEEVVSFTIPSRASPWRAPTTTRTGISFKDKNLVAWQEQVSLYASRAMAGRSPYHGKVELVMAFHFKPHGRLPDLSNCVKGTEDALQGSVIVNDTQVIRHMNRRIVGDEDKVSIGVYAMGED